MKFVLIIAIKEIVKKLMKRVIVSILARIMSYVNKEFAYQNVQNVNIMMRVLIVVKIPVIQIKIASLILFL